MVDIIFMGTPEYASTILERIISDGAFNVKAVYTQKDKPVGRKRIVTPPKVKEVALREGITLFQPDRLKDEEVIEELLAIEVDFIVVAAYGQILPKAILEHAPCINLHASILPRYRGASPIQEALLNGDTTTGITAMLMDEGLDTGDILKITEVDIKATMMAQELFTLLSDVAATLIVDVLKDFERLTPQPQDEALATYCKKITKADGEITLSDARSVYNRYRAFTPWPGIYLKSGLKLKEIALNEYESSSEVEGKIVSIGDNSIRVACHRGSLELFRVQPPSKKEMGVVDYINGQRLLVGDILS